MKIALTSVEDAGTVIRALRKQSGIRIDDFALTAKASKQFMSDLENGRPTVQMGRVLAMLQSMGVRMSLEVPDAAGPAILAEQKRRRLKAAILAESEDSPGSADSAESADGTQSAADKRRRAGA
jgi:transcriptional regulator with XRE-family HTH domain